MDRSRFKQPLDLGTDPRRALERSEFYEHRDVFSKNDKHNSACVKFATAKKDICHPLADARGRNREDIPAAEQCNKHDSWEELVRKQHAFMTCGNARYVENESDCHKTPEFQQRNPRTPQAAITAHNNHVHQEQQEYASAAHCEAHAEEFLKQFKERVALDAARRAREEEQKRVRLEQMRQQRVLQERHEEQVIRDVMERSRSRSQSFKKVTKKSRRGR